jgi:hypothetical protein
MADNTSTSKEKTILKPEGISQDDWTLALQSVKAEKLKRERIANGKDTLKYLVSYMEDNSYTNKNKEHVSTPKLSFSTLANEINLAIAGNKAGLKADGNDYFKMLTFEANGHKVESVEALTKMINDIMS